jgi:hypothetical protein
MQICEMRMRSVAVSLAGFLSLGGQTSVFAADLTVKTVTLYKHGVAYFEREAVVGEGDEARLDFKTADMNDVLKSLTVTEDSGARVSGIRYDSNETLEQRLTRYPFQIGNQELLSSFLDGLKGARMEVKTPEHNLSGSILSARGVASGGDGDKRIIREQLTLLLDSGDVTNVDLAGVTSLRLLDPKLQDDLKQYLHTLAQAKTRDRRSVYIDSTGRGNRTLHVSYIAPAAIWKSSYRLALADGGSTLEGWAIVDNTTDEDWNNVRLSVVSGRPISFISLLDTPRYGRREVAELPEDRAAGPVVYSGAVDGTAVRDSGVIGGVLGGVPGAPPPPAQATRQFVANQLVASNIDKKVQLESSAKLQTSSIEGATGAAVGELFEYNFAGPITVKRNQSAMLPFLQEKVSARKLLIYTEKDGEHPVNAAELTNSSDKTLDGGPITVYDGGSYAGEALFETLKAGDKRLVGYAVDYGTRISAGTQGGKKFVREIHAKNGMLDLHYSERSTRDYIIHNVDAKPKDLIIQEEGVHDHEVLSPKPTERTATAYRFAVRVPANGVQELKVEQERNSEDVTEVTNSTPDFLLSIIVNKEISEAGRKQLKALADLKMALSETENSLSLARTQANELTQDQTRLRADIDSLNRVKGQEDQVRKYSSQLADNEGQLAKLRDQRRDLELKKADLESQVRKVVDTLSF